MLSQIEAVLKEKNILNHKNSGITVCVVQSPSAGLQTAKQLLYGVVDRRTVLYLSGGSTPKELYRIFAQEEFLRPGAAGMIDERFGKKLHADSNEAMIKDSGLLAYFYMLDIPFYPMLTGSSNSRNEVSVSYDKICRRLLSVFPRHIGILGIGTDGHTAGIIPNRTDFKNPMFERSQKDLLVSDFFDANSPYGQRVSMTFLGLSLLDLCIVISFGQEKKNALESIFEDGSRESVPARFFKSDIMAKKTLFITDQTV
jgi:6-phosphogluconolactonase/glucosamine-6-phosphate isomerase/deaminase